jgi:hypothetical protein
LVIVLSVLYGFLLPLWFLQTLLINLDSNTEAYRWHKTTQREDKSGKSLVSDREKKLSTCKEKDPLSCGYFLTANQLVMATVEYLKQ